MNETIVVCILFGVLVAGCLIFAFAQEQALQDPENTTVIYTEQLRNVAVLSGSGSFILKTTRQSGNPHQEDRSFGSADEAISAAMGTLRRAKVESVRISINTPVQLALVRSMYSGRGASEGKKLGSIDIIKIG